MTTEPRASLVEVEQVDREAAADLVERYYPFEKGMARLARSMRGGHCDTATFTQAFARHRLEALRTQGDGEVRPIVNDYQRLAFAIVGRRLPASIQIGFISKEQCPVIDGDHADGFTLFPDDGSDPEIWIGNHVPIMGVPDTLFHEAAHVIAGLEADHGPEWQAANEALWAEMNGILASPTQASSREEG